MITIWGTYGEEIDCPVIWLKKIEPPPEAILLGELVTVINDEGVITGFGFVEAV